MYIKRYIVRDIYISSLRSSTEQSGPLSELLLPRFLLLLCSLPFFLFLFYLFLKLAAFVGFFNLKEFICNKICIITLSIMPSSTYLGFKEVLSSTNTDLVNIDLSECGELA